MNLQQLKEYSALNIKRLFPSDYDKNAVKKKIDNIKKLTNERDSLNKTLEKEAMDSIKFRIIPVWLFLFFCIPVIITIPTVAEFVTHIPWLGEKIFGANLDTSFVHDPFGVLLMCIISLLIIGAWSFFSFINRLDSETIGTFVYYAYMFFEVALCVGCGYLLYSDIAIPGGVSAVSVIFVAVGGILTMLGRLLENFRIRKSYGEYAQQVDAINKADDIMDELATIQKANANKYEAQIKKLCGGDYSLIPAKPWFEYIGKDHEFDKPWHIYSDLRGPIKSTSFTDDYSSKMSVRIVETSIDVRNQEYSFNDVDYAEALTLCKKNNMKPFFSFDVPEFKPEFRYSVLKHKWDIRVTIKTTTREEVTEKVTTMAQIDFDLETSVNETLEGYDRAKFERNADFVLMNKIKEYEEQKAKRRESLGATITRMSDPETKTKKRTEYGDVTGTILVYDEDNNLIGAYCDDSYEAIDYTRELVSEKTGTELSVFAIPCGDQQLMYMYYNVYLGKKKEEKEYYRCD